MGLRKYIINVHIRNSFSTDTVRKIMCYVNIIQKSTMQSRKCCESVMVPHLHTQTESITFEFVSIFDHYIKNQHQKIAYYVPSLCMLSCCNIKNRNFSKSKLTESVSFRPTPEWFKIGQSSM